MMSATKLITNLKWAVCIDENTAAYLFLKRLELTRSRIIIKSNSPRNYNSRSTELTLPASKAEILEAFDCAKIPYGSEEYAILPNPYAPKFIGKMLENSSPSIAEMNHLTERLGQLSEDEVKMYEGVLQARGSYDVAGAINATHNLNKFEFYPGVTTDYQLGEFAIENGILPILHGISDELVDCLDHKKVGALMREGEGGILTDKGYIIPTNSDWDIVYDGKSLAGRAVTLEPDDPIITLQVRPFEDTGDCEFNLDLPASRQHIETVLRAHGIPDLSEYIIQDATSVIPALNHAITPGEDIEKVNELAQAIKSIGVEQIAKYKAAYDMQNVISIEGAIELAERLNEYDFIQLPSIEEFGRVALAKTGMDVELAEEYGFDFKAYGCAVMDEQNIQFSPYGFISHPRGQELTMEQSPEQKQEVDLEPEQSIGPTMSI